MDSRTFREEAHKLVDWMADYFDEVEQYPVMPDLDPGEVAEQLPGSPPESGESFETIFRDFEQTIMPGMTHWESPRFMGYFPATKSYPSVLAEMLTATLGAQCMSWVTSPAATELEERMMDWLGGMIGMPDGFTGVIQDTASTATLCALLMAREQTSEFSVNERGFEQEDTFTVYCSSETHSSIEKDIKIAGFGRRYMRKISVDQDFAMDPAALEQAIRDDLEAGLKPACVVATIGTTGSTAIDPIGEIAEICSRYEIFLHVDAAYAGTALLLPEFRWMIEGIDGVDSFVFNPHKWMFTNFDCSAMFVKNEAELVRTFEIMPEYLKTPEDERVKNYRDWGIQLGRRFRALKLWFVIRSFGVEGLRSHIRRHIDLADQLADRIREHDHFELLAPVSLNLICFRFHPAHISDGDKLNQLNEQLLHRVNRSGSLFITHTRLKDAYTLRLVAGHPQLNRNHMDHAWSVIREQAELLLE